MQQRQYSVHDRSDRWLQIMRPAGEDGLDLAQDARVLVARMSGGAELKHSFDEGRGGYLYIIEGAVAVACSPEGSSMDITIVGTGNMARGIATRALAGRHAVTLLGTSAENAERLASELSGDVRAGTSGDPLAGDVVVLAVWYPSVGDVLGRYGDQFGGKVVVDITNPIDPEAFVPLTIEAGSVAQEIAAAVPGARVVKAFNTTFAGTLVDGKVGGQPLDVLMASDDGGAKDTVGQLVRDAGLRPVDAGPLALARQLEALGFLHMAVQGSLGTNFASAVKFLP